MSIPSAPRILVYGAAHMLARGGCEKPEQLLGSMTVLNLDDTMEASFGLLEGAVQNLPQ